MSKWIERVRKRREERQDKARELERQERRAKEEQVRRRQKEETERRFYDKMIQNKLAEKKRQKENEEEELRKRQADFEAERKGKKVAAPKPLNTWAEAPVVEEPPQPIVTISPEEAAKNCKNPSEWCTHPHPELLEMSEEDLELERQLKAWEEEMELKRAELERGDS